VVGFTMNSRVIKGYLRSFDERKTPHDANQNCAGDSWVLRATSLSALTSIAISGTRNGAIWSLPDWRSSEDDGALVVNGTFDATAVGDYTIWLTAAGKVSNTLPVTIETCPVR
jgi:hypothetical protein